MARKSISKSTRFEVFKRDSFTCQYCGRKSPDVILEIDHINPVSKGGENSIINYVTSCFDCNRGKSDKVLSGSQALEKERNQLELLNERREQMRLMVEWKKELQELRNEELDAIRDYFHSATNSDFTTEGEVIIKSLIKKYGFEEVLESTITSIDRYFKGDSDSLNKAFTYIAKVCNMRQKEKSDPYLKDKLYIRGILKNRITIYDQSRLTDSLNKIIQCDVDVSIIKDYAKECRNWTEFWDMVNECFGDENRRY